MGRATLPKGIEIRGGSIRISFQFRGEKCRETLKLKPTPANIKFAERKRGTILNEIATGSFDYVAHFPNSRRAMAISPASAGKATKVKRLLRDWISGEESTLAFSTWKDYYNSIENILIPEFGDLYISELTKQVLKSWIGGLSLSRKRVGNILCPLRAALADAVEAEWIPKNPVLLLPKLESFRNLSARRPEEAPDPFAPDEVKAILSAAGGQVKNLIQFAFSSGMRTGELLALRWVDIDFDGGLIKVRMNKTRGREKAPKTAAGLRDVKMNAISRQALKAQMEHTYMHGEKVFHNPNTNRPWSTDCSFRENHWAKVLSKAGVRYRYPYQTRHTYASTLLSAGENEKFVASQLGHKDVTMVRQTYGKWIPDVDPDAGSSLERIFTL